MFVVVIEEIVDDEKATSENPGTKQSKKKKQLADSNNEKKGEQQIVVKGTSGTSVLESEDEDGFPVSLSRETETNSEILEAKTTTGTAEGKITKKKKIEVEEAESLRSLKRKVESIDKNDEQKRYNYANLNYCCTFEQSTIVLCRIHPWKWYHIGKITMNTTTFR